MDANRTKIMRLMEIVGSTENIEAFMRHATDVMVQNLAEILGDDPVFGKIREGIAAKARERAGDLLGKVADVYAEALSEADIDAALAFQESGAGAALRAADRSVRERCLAIGEEWGRAIAQDVLAEVRAEAAREADSV